MKKAFQSLSLKNHFIQLPDIFYAKVEPQGLEDPRVVAVSESCARLLSIDPDTLMSQESLQILSGNANLDHSCPIAMKYFGHQFGYLNPDLGDGRGLLLGEVETPDKQLWDLHLKGSGTTPYSRDGDGRAVLRSSIREYLCSEAMAGLGIPTTRALSVISSTTPVYREQEETGAMLLRIAKTHIRFGHLEFAYHSGQTDLLECLCNYLIQRYYPDIADSLNPYAELFKAIATKTGSLIAQWQSVGFAHGVMNTDNMSILGDTFDYGPFGFMDRFVPGYVSNHSDHEGRYAFDRQPAIAQWNLSVLAQAMSPIVEKEALHEGLKAYSETFNRSYLGQMLDKLGLEHEQEGDQDIVFTTLNMMAQQGFDYTDFFRNLSHLRLDYLRDHAIDRIQFDSWRKDYESRLKRETRNPDQRQTAMLKANPKYILRNYLAQAAIEKAQQGDYSEVNRLCEILQTPYDEQPEFEDYAKLPPDWANGIEVSCSS